MRRTIPRYAQLAATAVVVTAPFATSETDRRLLLVGLAAVALASAQLSLWRSFIDRVPRWLVFALLQFYCVLIALAVIATGDAQSPYGWLYVLPVTFTAVFFTGRSRFGTPVLAAIAHHLSVTWLGQADVGDSLTRFAMLALVSAFAAEVSGMLREALRANSSLHAVLEAASGDPLSGELAGIGLDAALLIAQWDAGGVVLVDPDSKQVRIEALRGISDKYLPSYASEPQLAGAPALEKAILHGTIEYVPDLSAEYPDERQLINEGIVSMVGVPLRYHGNVLGALVLGHRSNRRLAEQEEDRLKKVAEQLGLALGNASLHRQERAVADQLRELNRRKDEFLANVSHELRTPAAAIKLVSSLLSSRHDDLRPGQLAEMHETLERRASHLCDLIDNLLDEALADAGATRLVIGPIDWREAVTRWAEMAQLQAGREITLILPAGSVTGVGDAAKLERVVANLLSNAAKFSDPGTPITVALRNDDASNDVIIEVRDQGIGIPDEQLDRIFDRFYQVDGGATRSAGGFGIGLSLTRHFVEAHGGTISVWSRQGQGTTFTVRLPRQVATSPTPPPSSTTTPTVL